MRIKDKFWKEYIILFLIVLFHLILLSNLIFFPYPELFIYSYLTSKGILPYKEIFDQHFPGLMFLPINFMTIGINSLARMRFIHFLTIILSDLLFYKISKNIFKINNLVFTALTLYVFWQTYLEGHVVWIETFVVPLILLSFLMILGYDRSKEQKDLILLFFILGITLIFKQTIIPLVFIIIILLFQKISFPKFLQAIFIFILPILTMVIYFYKMGALKDFLYWTITFNLTTFADMGRSYPEIVDLIKIFPIFLLPLILFILSKEKPKIFSYILFFLIGTAFFAYARFDFIHLQPSLPFSILLLTNSLSKIKGKKLYFFIILYSMFSLFLYIRYFKAFNKPGLSPMYNDITTIQVIEKIKYYSGGSEKIFSFGVYPHIYFLTKTMPPGNVFSFQFPWFMKVAQDKILSGIISDPPKVIIKQDDVYVDDINLNRNMPNIYEYITKNYRMVDRVGEIEILIKR